MTSPPPPTTSSCDANSRPAHLASQKSSAAFARVASSASYLLGSASAPAPSETAATLRSSASSSAKATSSGGVSGAPELATWAETVVPRATSTTGFPGSLAGPTGAASAQTDADFDAFAAAAASTPLAYSISNQHGWPPAAAAAEDPQDGAAVRNLLAMPMSLEMDPPRTSNSLANAPDLSHPAVAEFVECDDPVAFLQGSGWSSYTEEVWGNLLDVMQSASKEVEKGRKGKGTLGDDTAVGELRATWGRLRSRL